MKNAAIPKQAIVVDLCRIKRTVCERIAPIACEHGFSYIGGHPMAGRSAASSARRRIFSPGLHDSDPERADGHGAARNHQAFFCGYRLRQTDFSTPRSTTGSSPTPPSWRISPPAPMSNRRKRCFGEVSAGSYRDMTRSRPAGRNKRTELPGQRRLSHSTA